ncbi:flavodoxin family protein [Litoreibacter sp.]|nr:flavodoxin family protein [Litoreibacter sp.]
MPKIEIVYYSGTGNTAQLAELVAQSSGGRLWALENDGMSPKGMWEALDAADTILFGSPTYMGGPAWQFKRFADATGARWDKRTWQDKLAGGFTTSGSTVGDKGECMSYFITLGNQHGMIWISLGQSSPPSRDNPQTATNWSGGNGGVMAIAGRDGMPEGDLQSARDYGARVLELTQKFAR